MKFEVLGPVAIFQNDAILGLTADQAHQRKHQLESLGGGRYRVISTNVKFRYREVVEIIDGPAAKTALKDEAAALGIRFGMGVGEKTLADRITADKREKAAYEKKADSATIAASATASIATAHAVKARKKRG